jgi:hypothetical protein
MRIRILALGLLLAAAALVGPGAARAGDEEASPPEGVWVFEVRVVRVDPATPETSEAPSALESVTGTTVKTGWPEILAVLKKRGKTTLLLDQRLTTLHGTKGQLNSERSVPILALNSEDMHNAQKRSATVKTGCKFEATVTEHMTYRLEARWTLDAPGGDHGPPQLTTQWQGSHPALKGDTLVLSYREQVDQGAGKAARAVEIYGLVTGNFVNKD